MPTISNLTTAAALDGTEELPATQAAQTVKVTLSDIIPPGGTTGQVLAKASNSDYDLVWVTP